MSGSNERRLRQPDERVREILDQLDKREPQSQTGTARGWERFSYRVSKMVIEVQSPSGPLRLVSPTRNLSRSGVSFLSSNFIYPGSICTVNLVTIHNQYIPIQGVIVRCMYVQGTGNVHECGVKFNQPIDVTIFNRGAKQMRVLVADDSPMMQTLIARLLKRLNCQVAAVENGRQAVELARRERFGLVLLDIEMPEQDGLSAVKELRLGGYLRPVLAITASADQAMRAACRAAGFDDLVPKPIDQAQLASVVNDLIDEPLISALIYDQDMYESIDAFVGTIQQRVSEIEKLFSEGDAEKLQGALRTLKGESGSCGFNQLAAMAAELEMGLAALQDTAAVEMDLRRLVRLAMAARPARSHSDTFA